MVIWVKKWETRKVVLVVVTAYIQTTCDKEKKSDREEKNETKNGE